MGAPREGLQLKIDSPTWTTVSGRRSPRVMLADRPTVMDLEAIEFIQAALEWRNLVRMLWIEMGSPQVPGFPASRVKQILWGELPASPGFFSALQDALVSRSQAKARAGFQSWLVEAIHRPRLAECEGEYPALSHGLLFEVPRVIDAASLIAGAEEKPDEADSQPEQSAELCTAATHSVIHTEAVRRVLGGLAALDPSAIETEADFMVALRRMKEQRKLSLRDIEERSKATAADWLPRSSAADMLRRETLPKPEVLWAFTAACGLSKDEQDQWEAARNRLQKQSRARQRHLARLATTAIDDLEDKIE
jgi:hypothetical protein